MDLKDKRELEVYLRKSAPVPLRGLLRLDACCVEDVDWDNLLEHRSGDITLKRWRRMVNHIGTHGLQSFAEQVEVLAERYYPELLEVREALDSRPVVD
ncbi:hypothetical protein C5167_037791 [Papaver somniferum]|uniref:Uncharacterized protein n=1 Tax=Papaver somniferum TaxID=3469 RepID=A0A4Y7IBR3_PAPSO|nr:hypothetical protein C5167_037791 [Papaver somniferum]